MHWENKKLFKNIINGITLWMNESFRVLKNTGAIYLFTPWQYSGMYHSLVEWSI